MFLVNAYDLTIDPKNRLSIPSAVRSKMNEDTEGRCFYILPGDRRSILNLFAERYFESMRRGIPSADRLSKEARDYRRFEASMTALVEPDTQGRVVIPERLLTFSGMSREVVLVGAIDHLEMWSAAEYRAFHDQIGSSFESIRERAIMELTSYAGKTPEQP